MKNQTIQIRISEDLKNRLKDISDKSGIPMSKIIVKALEHEINVEEYLRSSDYLNDQQPPDDFEYHRHPTEMDLVRDDIEVLKQKVDLILQAVKK